jgi:hypothetical protein
MSAQRCHAAHCDLRAGEHFGISERDRGGSLQRLAARLPGGMLPSPQRSRSSKAKGHRSRFVQVPSEAIPELRRVAAWIAFGGLVVDNQKPLFETYRGQRQGFDLVAYLMVRTREGTRSTECGIHDFGAARPVSDKRVMDWIGRPADNPAEGSQHRRWQAGPIAALPGGYDEVASVYHQPGRVGPLFAGALLHATARSSLAPAAK